MSDLRDIAMHFQSLISSARDPREAQDIMREYQKVRDRYAGYSMMPVYPISYPSMATSPYLGDDPKPQKPLPEEHLVSAVTGYRAWNVPLFVDELRSVAKASKWLPYQRFEAQCAAQQCEGVSCQCGIYAFNQLKLVKDEYRGEGKSRKYVYGEVYLWGRVLECKDGYRAQFAYPKAFVNTGAVAKRMSEVFGVPLL